VVAARSQVPRLRQGSRRHAPRARRGRAALRGEKTRVEVTFDASPSGTVVTVTHSGWSAIRPDHPARHGLDVPAFIRMNGMWWGDVLTSFRQHAAAAAVSDA
jgi:hypothetical protein